MGTNRAGERECHMKPENKPEDRIVELLETISDTLSEIRNEISDLQSTVGRIEDAIAPEPDDLDA